MNNSFIKKLILSYKKFTPNILLIFQSNFLNLSLQKKEELCHYISKRQQKHKFHIVSPSPWPFLTSISAFIFVSGMVMYMHNITGGGLTLLTGVLLIASSMFLWFQDIIREATFMGYHTLKVQSGLRLGFLLFIVSEIMFFFAFFWAYFHVSVCPSIFVGGVWPPEGIVSYVISNENILSPFYIFDRDFSEKFYPINGIENSQSPGFFSNNLFNATWDNEFPSRNYLNVIPGDEEWNEGYIMHPILSWVEIKYELETDEVFFDKLIQKLDDLYSSDYKPFSNAFTKFNSQIKLSITDTGLLINPMSIPLLNTIILLSSGAILTLSHTYLRLERYYFSIISLFITIIFGLAFFGFQVFEYTYAGFSINDGVYGTVFYMLTGFHGFHVFIGTVFLIVCLIRFLVQHFTPSNHFGFEAAIWYWHFVDVVWIFLFFFVYLWPNYTFFYPGEELLYHSLGNSFFDVSINLSTSVFEDDSIINNFLPPYENTSDINLIDKKKLISYSLNYIENKYINNQNLIDYLINLTSNPSFSQGQAGSFGNLWEYLLGIWHNYYGWSASEENFPTPFSKFVSDELFNAWYSDIVLTNEFIAKHSMQVKFTGINHIQAFFEPGYMGTLNGLEHNYNISDSRLFLGWDLSEDDSVKFYPENYPNIDFSTVFTYEIPSFIAN